uniref:Uncharacterized protein n=1 Tax=Oryza glaberrima TaxID=4538 RepID=I1QTN0_ORYGL
MDERHGSRKKLADDVDNEHVGNGVEPSPTEELPDGAVVEIVHLIDCVPLCSELFETVDEAPQLVGPAAEAYVGDEAEEEANLHHSKPLVVLDNRAGQLHQLFVFTMRPSACLYYNDVLRRV